MKSIVRTVLCALFVSTVALACYLIFWVNPRRIETWSALVADLAVIAALLAAYPALRILDLQEDALRPRPVPYFDLTSRYDLLQLRVKNLGASAAYDIKLVWDREPMKYKDGPANDLNNISVLLPEQSVSVLLGTAHDKVSEWKNEHFIGACTYKDSSGRFYTDRFICSVDGSRKQLLHDEELARTLYDIQQLPKLLEEIGAAIKALNKTQDTRNTPSEEELSHLTDLSKKARGMELETEGEA